MKFKKKKKSLEKRSILKNERLISMLYYFNLSAISFNLFVYITVLVSRILRIIISAKYFTFPFSHLILSAIWKYMHIQLNKICHIGYKYVSFMIEIFNIT